MSWALTLHLIAAGLHRAFQHIAHAQILADRLGVDRLALVGEGSVARDDEAVVDARESGGQFIGEDVGEVILRRIAGEIGERQHDDGKTLSRERRRRVRGDGRRSVRAGQIPRSAREQNEQCRDPGGDRGQRRTLFRRGRFRLGKLADLERIDPDRLGDVLELRSGRDR